MSAPFILACINRRQDAEQPSCATCGGLEIFDALCKAAEGRHVTVESCCCFGHCAKGPVVRIGPGGAFYHGVTLADVPRILADAEQLAAP